MKQVSVLYICIFLAICSSLKAKVKKLNKSEKSFLVSKKGDESVEAESVISTGKDLQPLTLDKAELGNFSWKVLHSFAAGYPLNPTDEDKIGFKWLIKSFAQLYPCETCRNNFRELIKKIPIVDGNSREEVVVYVCQLHNDVNKRLGKKEFDCSKALEKWGGGKKSCGCSDKKAN